MIREDGRAVGVCLGISGAVIALTRSHHLVALADVTWPLGLWQQQPGQQTRPAAVARRMLKRARRRLGLPRSCEVSVVIGPSLSDRRPEDILARSFELLEKAGLPQTWITPADEAEALKQRMAPVVGKLGVFAAGEEAGLAIGAAISVLAVPRAPTADYGPPTATPPIGAHSGVVSTPAPADTGMDTPVAPALDLSARGARILGLSDESTPVQGMPVQSTPGEGASSEGAPGEGAPSLPIARMPGERHATAGSADSLGTVSPAASMLPPESDASASPVPAAPSGPAPPQAASATTSTSSAPHGKPTPQDKPVPPVPVAPGIWPVTVTVPAPVLLPTEPEPEWEPEPQPGAQPGPERTVAGRAPRSEERPAVFPIPPRRERQ